MTTPQILSGSWKLLYVTKTIMYNITYSYERKSTSLPWLMGKVLLSGKMVSITSQDIFCFAGVTAVCCCNMSVILLNTSFNLISLCGDSSKKCSISFIIVLRTRRKQENARYVRASSGGSTRLRRDVTNFYRHRSRTDARRLVSLESSLRLPTEQWAVWPEQLIEGAALWLAAAAPIAGLLSCALGLWAIEAGSHSNSDFKLLFKLFLITIHCKFNHKQVKDVCLYVY